MATIQFNILNQLQTPAFYASSLATRPAFGFDGRVFIDTDIPSTGLYRDTGSAWVAIADPGAGTTGTLQQVTTNGNTTTLGINVGGRLNVNGATDNVLYGFNVLGTANIGTQIISPQYQFASSISLASQSSGNNNIYSGTNSFIVSDSTGAISLLTIGGVSGSGIFKGSVTANGLSSVADNVYLSNRALTAAAAQFQAWFNSANTRRAYFGFGSGGDDTFSLINETGGINVIGGNTTFTGTLGINNVADSVKGGTYNPSASNAVNCSTFVFTQFRYIRVGNICKVQGSVTFTRTAINTYFDISLPISSTLTTGEGSGVITSTTNLSTGYIASTVSGTIGVTTNNTIAAGTLSYFLEFTYIIQ